MKVILSAYACEPHKGSEPYVGWTWAHAIARIADEVHVITRQNNRAAIESALAQQPVQNLHFHYFDLPGWASFWKRGQLGVQLYYYLWQYQMQRFAAHLHDRYGFDLAHHVSMAGMYYPPGLASLPVPFIWGPLGGLHVPPVLRQDLHLTARASEFAHDGLIQLARRDPLVRRAFRTARFVLAMPQCIPVHKPLGEVVRTGNIFIDTDSLPLIQEPGGGNHHNLKLVSAFRLIFWKGGDLGMEALARLKARGVPVRWTLVGDGPERPRWESLARRLGVADLVEFRGQLSRAETLTILTQGDVLLHPAYREGWGGAVLEGMALGLPVVCLDWGGPGFIVNEESGIRVPVVQSRQAVVDGLADALDKLKDPTMRQRMGEAGRLRVKERLSLGALNRMVETVYQENLP